MSYRRYIECDACGTRVDLVEDHTSAHGWFLVQTLADRHRPHDRVVAVDAHVCSLGCLQALAGRLLEQVAAGTAPTKSVSDYLREAMDAAAAAHSQVEWRPEKNAYL